MADDPTKKTPNPTKNDDKPSADADAPVPNASAEPVTQAAAVTSSAGGGSTSSASGTPASGSSSSTTPSRDFSSTTSGKDSGSSFSPSSYEMPDDYAAQDWVAKAKAWAEENPALALLAAAGVGLLAGRVVTALIPEPEPPSLLDRVEKRAEVLRKETDKRSKKLRKEAVKRGKVYKKEAAKRGKVYKKEASAFADDAGDTLQDSLHRASEALREAAASAGETAEVGYERTKDIAETIADAAKVAVTGVLASKLDEWTKKARD